MSIFNLQTDSRHCSTAQIQLEQKTEWLQAGLCCRKGQRSWCANETIRVIRGVFLCVTIKSIEFLLGLGRISLFCSCGVGKGIHHLESSKSADDSIRRLLYVDNARGSMPPRIFRTKGENTVLHAKDLCLHSFDFDNRGPNMKR